MAPLAAVGVEPGRVPGKACTATTLLVASSLPKLEPRAHEETGATQPKQQGSLELVVTFDGDEVGLPGDGPGGADAGGADEAVGDAVEERVAQVQERAPVHARQLVLERPGVQPAHLRYSAAVLYYSIGGRPGSTTRTKKLREREGKCRASWGKRGAI